jgi:hypothetical protein
MRTLRSSLRKQLETSVLAARRAAEAASRAAIESLGVFADRRPEHLDAMQAALRNGLRAKWRLLGNGRDLLVAECAYEQWHRLLFARFLAENGLLLHPQFRAPVTLAECEELAAELGEPDAWSVAARFAAEILPGIFRLDDPCVRLRLAPEGRHALEQILDAIPAETFITDDALGWVYQFWQKDKKDEVNASERKIGGADLGPVTQLFTENYMVRFLLENSLGAWWAAWHPDSLLVKGFEFLRFDNDGKPAAGTFDGWPKRVAEITVMDPCCGSGHFLVEAFSMLWKMRVEEEGLAPVDAQDAVLRDNLFGLELDSRCVQIAMFAVALQAWKAGDGWRQLPVPNVSCSGIPVKAPVEEWKALAGGDELLENALVRLHILFRDADTLGSLIDPRRATEVIDPTGLQASLDDADWSDVAPVLERALVRESPDPARAVLQAEVLGSARAADLLTEGYTIVVTNVPYLERRSQSATLLRYIDTYHNAARFDLATAFVERAQKLCSASGSAALVVPQNWLFLASYARLREWLLKTTTLASVVWLGAGAFGEITGEVVKPALLTFTNALPVSGSSAWTIDVSESAGPTGKTAAIQHDLGRWIDQREQLRHTGARILAESIAVSTPLAEYATSLAGMMTSDLPRFVRYFWELRDLGEDWEYFQSTSSSDSPYTGLSQAIFWQKGSGTYRAYVDANRDHLGGAPLRGRSAWGKSGVAISQMSLNAALYCGSPFDNNVAVVLPIRHADLAAIWAFCRSEEFSAAVRVLDRKMNVTNATLGHVPFDIDHWRKAAEESDPLPEPWSDDPTQWLFKGRPDVSTSPLQVAVGRLVGYRWPEQPESDGLDVFADADGIVCLPAVAGEPPAADRVQQLLAAAFGESWTSAKVKELLEQAGSKKKLADWLRDDFFKQHCLLFENRPFVWHIWDGQRDGFSALVNYHRLDRKTLEKLTYTYLGQDWVERQRAEVRDGVAGAEARLAAALGLQKRLEAILEGEAPLDIYVRWKEIHEQPTGWEPDLNDGVRLNIRPFVGAGVLRSPFNIHWRKDRGKNPDGTERLNDVHVTLTEKIVARKRVDRA